MIIVTADSNFKLSSRYDRSVAIRNLHTIAMQVRFDVADWTVPAISEKQAGGVDRERARVQLAVRHVDYKALTL